MTLREDVVRSEIEIKHKHWSPRMHLDLEKKRRPELRRDVKNQAAVQPPIDHLAPQLKTRVGAGVERRLAWLDEGIAVYTASPYEPEERSAERLSRAVDWAKHDQLPAWSDLSDFNSTPQELWQFVYPMGYCMVRFITETYGQDKRNAWLAAMATEMTIDEATPSVLGPTFDQLDSEFLAWLSDQ